MFFDGKIRLTILGVTTAEALVGVSAGNGVPPTFAESDLDAYAACFASTDCPAEPLVGCRAAGKAKIQLRDDSDPASDQLKWKWLRGDATSMVDFGSPTVFALNTFCIWDRNAGLAANVFEAVVPAGALWRTDATRHSYKDKTGINAGVQKVQLKPGESGKAKLTLKARGVTLPLPPPVDVDRFFDADPEIVMQLVNAETGVCWTSEFAGADAINRADQFKAAAP
jgi:hypothetical protein